jgi:hypothetical protein
MSSAFKPAEASDAPDNELRHFVAGVECTVGIATLMEPLGSGSGRKVNGGEKSSVKD